MPDNTSEFESRIFSRDLRFMR